MTVRELIKELINHYEMDDDAKIVIKTHDGEQSNEISDVEYWYMANELALIVDREDEVLITHDRLEELEAKEKELEELLERTKELEESE